MKAETRQKRSRIHELQRDIRELKELIAKHQQEIDGLQNLIDDKQIELNEKLGYQTLEDLGIEY